MRLQQAYKILFVHLHLHLLEGKKYIAIIFINLYTPKRENRFSTFRFDGTPPLNLNSYIWRHFNRVGETTRNIPKQIKEKKYIIQSSLKIAYLFQWAVDQAKRLLIRSTFYKVDHYFKGKKKNFFILCFCIMCHLTNIQKQ